MSVAILNEVMRLVLRAGSVEVEEIRKGIYNLILIVSQLQQFEPYSFKY